MSMNPLLSRSRLASWGSIALMALVLLGLLVLRPNPVPTATAAISSTPCLPEDPFDLDDLRVALSVDTPPSTPVRINEFIMVEYVGSGELVEDEPDVPENEEPSGNPNPTEPPLEETEYGAVEFSVFNSRTKFEFKVTMEEEMLDDIYNCHATTGRTDGSIETIFTFLPLVNQAGEAAGEPAADTRGWTNGIDNRVQVNNPNIWPTRTIAQFRGANSTTHNSNCTGTLIGPRHIITAAHCINAQGTNNWFTIRITPAKNGFGTDLAQEPYGNTVVSLNPAPGTEVWYFTPWQWRDSQQTGWQWDWGLLVIPDRLGDEASWMGYFAATSTYLNSVSKWNRGYAQCNTARGNSPVPCNNGRMYADPSQCDIGSFSNAGADGWNRRVSIGCDLSGGHSGSPIYFWHKKANNTFVPVVSLIVNTEACSLNCAANNNFPNGAVRLTPANMGTISWLRETFP